MFNDVYLNSDKTQLLNNEELFMGLSIALVSLFTIYVLFNKMKESMFGNEGFLDYFESQQRFQDRMTKQMISQHIDQLIQDFKESLLNLIFDGELISF